MEFDVVRYVLVPILVWMGLVVILFVLLLRRFTFAKGGENPYKNETFAMPRGVLRGVLTVSVMFVVLLLQVLVFYLAHNDVSTWEHLQHVFDPIMTAFQMIIAFYFGGKVVDHLADVDRETAQHRVDAVLSQNAPHSGEPTATGGEPEAVG